MTDRYQKVEAANEPAEKLIHSAVLHPLDFKNEALSPNLPREVAWLGTGVNLIGDPQSTKIFHPHEFTRIDRVLADGIVRELSENGASPSELNRYFSLPYDATHGLEAPRTLRSAADGPDVNFTTPHLQLMVVSKYTETGDDPMTKRVVKEMELKFNSLGMAPAIVVGDSGLAFVPTFTRGRRFDEQRDFIPLTRKDATAEQVSILMDQVCPNPNAIIVSTTWRPSALITNDTIIDSLSSVQKRIERDEKIRNDAEARINEQKNRLSLATSVSK